MKLSTLVHMLLTFSVLSFLVAACTQQRQSNQALSFQIPKGFEAGRTVSIHGVSEKAPNGWNGERACLTSDYDESAAVRQAMERYKREKAGCEATGGVMEKLGELTVRKTAHYYPAGPSLSSCEVRADYGPRSCFLAVARRAPAATPETSAAGMFPLRLSH